MEALLVVILVVVLALVLANTAGKNDRLEAENEAFKIVIASMQRDERESENGDGIGAGLMLLGLLVVLALLVAA